MLSAPTLLHSFVSVDGIASRLERCAGNACLLTAHAAPPCGAPAGETGATYCQSWPGSRSDETEIAIRCYTHQGQLIQCCGHGLLAAAHTWQRRLRRDTVRLSMNGSLVPGWREGDLTWLRFARLRMQGQDVPAWLEHVFCTVEPAQAVAIAGEARAYLVLQWPDGFDLQRLPCPTIALSAWTRRALICTSARPEWGEGVIQLRYFAPQYGVAEDAATGSAMRVLAQYWSRRFSELTAYQCSPSGGLLLSRCAGKSVDVGGRCVSSAAASDD